jgi:uncharacterized protein DUF5648
MLMACLRLGLVLATLLFSLHVAAAPRYWTLTGVEFRSGHGGHGSGYFSYDDATQAISNWSVRVDFPFFELFPAFTYVPGNSTASVIQTPGAGGAPTLVFSATMGVPGPFFGMRQLRLAPLAALDGSNVTVSLAGFSSKEEFPSLQGPDNRWVTAGSLMLTPVPPPIAIAQVDEFYHPALRHYFITADAAEKQLLDTGVHAGWQRTGESFKAYAKGSNPGDSVNPVCRSYAPPKYLCDYYSYCDGGPDSHFFSADAGECLTVFRGYGRIWQSESDNAFQIDVPDKTTGACQVGTTPVYRLWNQRADSNHRYATSAAIRAQMIAAGYLEEGIVMCAVQ